MSWGEPTGPIDVTPSDLNAAATTFAGGQSRLDGIADALGSALRDAAGMAGDDTYGKQFAKSYDPAVKALFRTVSAAVRAIGQSADGLVRTANNYLKADHHSNPRAGKGAPKLFGWPDVVDDIMYPDPPTAIGGGSNHWPPPLRKYWVNGHQDKLRDAAAAFRTAATDITNLGVSLHLQVQAITDVNTSGAVSAMAAFWGRIWKDGDPGGLAPLSTAYLACTKLASVCESFAHAIDKAHSEFEHKMSEAGIAMGITTTLGILGTVFTLGGSDAGAAALDAGEAAALFASVDTVMDAVVADSATESVAELETVLASAAEEVPEVEAVDAETTEVTQALDRELAEAEAREPGVPRSPEEGPPPTEGPAKDALVKDLQDSGVKCDPSKIVRIERGADGKIRFLEQGNSRAGLQHIIEEHSEDFANKGIPEGDIPDVVMRAVTAGKQIGMQGTRPIYEIMHQGRLLKVAVTVGSNGFIVGANPTS